MAELAISEALRSGSQITSYGATLAPELGKKFAHVFSLRGGMLDELQISACARRENYCSPRQERIEASRASGLSAGPTANSPAERGYFWFANPNES
jgi:hypothetical protein